jgi:hypothetical protein
MIAEGGKHGIMVKHPAAGVFIDVSKPGWEKEMNNHTLVCQGSGQVAQFSQIEYRKSVFAD